MSIQIFFDNAHGITVQNDTYCHHFYGREEEAVECVWDLLNAGERAQEWEGNEPEHRVSTDQEDNYSLTDIRDLLKTITAIATSEDPESVFESIQGVTERDFFRILIDNLTIH